MICQGTKKTREAQAAGGKVTSPTGTAPDRYVYYPGTEELKPDEIRLIACGNGLPAARRGQAASCFLVELGNGDKFLLDIGSGSMANIASLMIPYQYLDKVFLSHLHTDHMGDILGLWAGGWVPAFKAQDEMLDRHMKKYNLQEMDWRPEMYKGLKAK